MSITLRLLNGEHEERRWGPDGRDAALEAFWSHAASLTTWDEPRPWRWTLEISNLPPLTLKDEPLAEAALYAVRARWSEPGFRAALVHRHARQLASPKLDLVSLFDVPPALSEPVSTIAEVLSRVFSVGPPRHLGHAQHAFPRREGDRLCVTQQSGVHANGAGTLTHTEDWFFSLDRPTLQVSGDSTSEEGTQTWWSWKMNPPSGFSPQPLLDAFKEQGLLVGV